LNYIKNYDNLYYVNNRNDNLELKMNQKKDLIALPTDDSLSKANILINSKYRATLNYQKILFANLLKLQEKKYKVDPKTTSLIVTSSAHELIQILDVKSGSLYNQLENIAESMLNIPMGYKNPETEEFDYLNLIDRATYKDGVFTVKFNPDVKDYLVNLKTSFTKLPRKLMMSWKSVYAYRLYELLKQRAYYPKDWTGAKQGVFKAKYDIYELRLLLGVVNSNLDSVKRILKKSNPPDYKAACEASPEKLYSKFNDFKRKVLDTGISEINSNELSELKVEYEIFKAAHGKIYAVEFSIYHKEYYKTEDEIKGPEVKEKESLDENEKFITYTKVFNLLSTSIQEINYTNVINICEESKYDIDTVTKAYRAYEEYKKYNEVNNPIGFIIKAIRENYDSTIKNKSNYEKSNFLRMEEQDYDFDYLEKALHKAQEQRLNNELQNDNSDIEDAKYEQFNMFGDEDYLE